MSVGQITSICHYLMLKNNVLYFVVKHLIKIKRGLLPMLKMILNKLKEKIFFTQDA